MPSSNFDAIIIGSGLGGLSCGACLAQNRKKVLVLEKQSSPGGYATSFRRGDYTFNAVLHMLEGVGKGQGFASFFESCGVFDSVEFLKLKYSQRIIFPEHDLSLPSGDLAGVMAVLIANFPNEKEGIRRFFVEMVRIYGDSIKLLLSTAPMWQLLPMFPFRFRRLFFSMGKTLKQQLDKHLNDEKLKALLFANYGYYGLPPSTVNIYAAIGNTSYWMEGAYYPKGGDQSISKAFVDVIKHNGGEVLLGCDVTSIIIENQRAIGVVTANGTRYFGKDVISNASPSETFRHLIGKDKLPPNLFAKMDKMEPSVSAFVVYIGLDETFKATLESSDDYEIFVSETYNLEEDYAFTRNLLFDKAAFAITLYSNVDSSLAKGNRFVASLTQLHPYDYWTKYEAAYMNGNKEEYNKEKDRIAGMLINRAEKVVPHLSKHIDVIEIATPLTLRRYTDNLNGACYGWANTVKQFTPRGRTLKMPIKNLHLVGHWTWPGEGHASVVACGYRLAKRLQNK